MNRKKIIDFIRNFDKTGRVKVSDPLRNSSKIYINDNNNRRIANLLITFLPDSTVYLAVGGTSRNFRKSGKKYGTFIRALATRAAIHGNANKVTHHGVNEDHLVLKQYAKNRGLSYLNALTLFMRQDPNFLKNLPPPISTQIVRKLGFRQNTGHPYSSVFYKNMNTQKLNEILNQWKAHP